MALQILSNKKKPNSNQHPPAPPKKHQNLKHQHEKWYTDNFKWGVGVGRGAVFIEQTPEIKNMGLFHESNNLLCKAKREENIFQSFHCTKETLKKVTRKKMFTLFLF